MVVIKFYWTTSIEVHSRVAVWVKDKYVAFKGSQIHKLTSEAQNIKTYFALSRCFAILCKMVQIHFSVWFKHKLCQIGVKRWFTFSIFGSGRNHPSCGRIHPTYKLNTCSVMFNNIKIFSILIQCQMVATFVFQVSSKNFNREKRCACPKLKIRSKWPNSPPSTVSNSMNFYLRHKWFTVKNICALKCPKISTIL